MKLNVKNKSANKMFQSNEYVAYLRKIKRNKAIILTLQLSILVCIFALWELLAILNLIDTFIMSSPSRIVNQIGILLKNETLFYHIGITLYEAIIGFLIATLGGTTIAPVPAPIQIIKIGPNAILGKLLRTTM